MAEAAHSPARVSEISQNPSKPPRVVLPSVPGDLAASATLTGGAGQRYCENPTSWRVRLAGLAGTASLAALMLFAVLFTWRVVRPTIVSRSPPLVVELHSLAAPPEPVRELAPGPVQVERQEADPQPDRETPPPVLVLLSRPSSRETAPPHPAEIVEPGPPVLQATAPKSIAAPSADRLSSDARPDWEASVLAHLEHFRRYPARARAARQQGVVYIRFTMDRSGQVLSSAIARKSGFFTLDQAALDTLKRAQPLPGIPSGRPDVVELTVPIQFELD